MEERRKYKDLYRSRMRRGNWRIDEIIVGLGNS